MLKKINSELAKLENCKNKAIEMKNKYETQIEVYDAKIKKLNTVKKKYEQLESDIGTILDE